MHSSNDDDGNYDGNHDDNHDGNGDEKRHQGIQSIYSTHELIEKHHM